MRKLSLGVFMPQVFMRFVIHLFILFRMDWNGCRLKKVQCCFLLVFMRCTWRIWIKCFHFRNWHDLWRFKIFLRAIRMHSFVCTDLYSVTVLIWNFYSVHENWIHNFLKLFRQISIIAIIQPNHSPQNVCWNYFDHSQFYSVFLQYYIRRRIFHITLKKLPMWHNWEVNLHSK